MLVLVALALCQAALVTMGVKEDDVENIPSIKSIEDKAIANINNNIEEFSKKYRERKNLTRSDDKFYKSERRLKKTK